MRRSPLAAAMLALALLGAPARAADPLGEAKAYYDAGVRAYAAAKYEVAVEAFREAYRLAPRETVLFSLAQAERRQYTVSLDPAILQDAIGHFRKYLSDVPKGGRRSDAVEALGELDSIAARLTDASAERPTEAAPRVERTRIMVSSLTAGATIVLDGKASTEATILESVEPGKHQLLVTAPGHVDEKREIVAVEGALVPVEITLHEKPSFLRIAAPDGAQILVDGQRIGEAPLERGVQVASGAHAIAVTSTGHVPFQTSVSVERGATELVQASLPRTLQRRVSFGLMGVTAATLLGAGVLSGAALNAESQSRGVLSATSTRSLTPSELADYNASLELRDDLRTGAVVLFGAAAAVGLVSAGLYVFDDPAPLLGKPKRAASIREVSLTVTGASVGLGVSGSF